jgi:hypothetical protein
MAQPTIKNSIDLFPQDILAGIGEVVAQWGYLHYQLGVIIREVTRIQKDTGRVLTVGPELGVICSILLTLTFNDRWITDKKIRDDIRQLAKDVRDASDHRNEIAHGVFILGERPSTYARLLVKSNAHRIKPDEEPITVASLKRLAAEAHEFWERSQDATLRPKAWKRKHG